MVKVEAEFVREIVMPRGCETIAGRLFGIGNPDLVNRRKIGLLCSIQCPGDIILKTLDLMTSIRDADCCIVSGFHSPIEQECLKVLLRGTCGIVICPARSLPKRVPVEYRETIDNGRMLLLSAFDDKKSRATSEVSMQRNRLVAALSDAIFVPYAAEGGKTEALCRESLQLGRRVMTFGGAHNASLVGAGAVGVAVAGELLSQLESGG